MSIAERILNADDLKREVLHIEEWGVDVLVISMTARERGSTEDYIRKKGGEKAKSEELYADLCIMAARDPVTEELIFQRSHRDRLAQKNAKPVCDIVITWMRLSGMAEDAVEQAAKNSETADD